MLAARTETKARSRVQPAKNQPVEAAFSAIRDAVVSLAVLSGTVNLLALTGSFYMLQVYDRVLSSKSIPTLVALSMLALILYAFQGILEVTRAQLLVRLGGRIDRRLVTAAHDAALRMPLMGRSTAEAQQPVRDVDTIRSFLGGQGPVAILDMPWMPLYLGFVFILHPLLGVVTAIGALVLGTLTLITEQKAKAPSRALVIAASRRQALADSTSRNAEVLRAMGMGPRALNQFAQASIDYLKAQEALSDLTQGYSSVSRVFRLVLQSALLGLGAYLTIKGEMSAGAIIACSIASSRAFMPIEVAIANWKGFVAARHGVQRLKATFETLKHSVEPLKLPPPTETLTVENITVAIPGTQRAVVTSVGFELKAGQGLAIIGQSAAGKSSLIRAIVGVWGTVRGAVRYDGAPIERWSPVRLGRHIGYLPQDVELFDGTVAENIARFDPKPESQAVIEAAREAGVHDMIMRLPEGYETRLGDRGAALSAGQRQRVALARALYGKPFLLVLDEPNSNLDAEGEDALATAIRSVRARRGIVIVVAHRPGVLAAVDTVAVMGNGQLVTIGPRDEVMRKAVRKAPAPGVSVIGEAPQRKAEQLAPAEPA